MMIDCRLLCKYTERQLSIADAGYDGTKPSGITLDCVTDISNGFNGRVGLQSFPEQRADPCCDAAIVKLWYNPKDCAPAAETEDIDCDFMKTCDDLDTTGIAEEYVEVKLTKSVTGKFAFDAKNCTCLDQDFQFFEGMRREAQKMLLSYQRGLLKSIFGNLGNYHPDGLNAGADSNTSPAVLKLFTHDGRPQPMGFFPARREYNLQCGEGSQVYALTGSAHVEAFNYATGLYNANGCCYDPSKLSNTGFRFCNDIGIETCLKELGVPASNPVVTIKEGAFKILEYYHFEAGSVESGDATRAIRNKYLPALAINHRVRTKLDLAPFLGGRRFEVDAHIYIDPHCSDKVIVKMQKIFDVFKLPTDAYNCNDTNGCLLWDTDCASIACSDWCPPPAP